MKLILRNVYKLVNYARKLGGALCVCVCVCVCVSVCVCVCVSKIIHFAK